MLALTLLLVMMSMVVGDTIPFKNLSEVKRGKAQGLIISECSTRR